MHYVHAHSHWHKAKIYILRYLILHTSIHEISPNEKNQKQHPEDTEYQFLIERMLLSWLNNLVFK